MHNTFRVNNLEDLHYFLSLSDKSFIDVMLVDNNVILINDGSSFGYLSYRGVQSCDPIAFRISRSLFARLVTDGYVYFDVQDGMVTCEMRDDSDVKYVEFSFQQQEVFSAAFTDKVQCVAKLKEAELFQIRDILTFLQIARAYQSNISFANDLASIKLPGRGKIFQAIKTPQQFGIQAQNLSKLLGQSTTLFSIGNYIGVHNKSLTVLQNKLIADDNEDFEFLYSQKSAYVCKLDLTGVRQVVSRLKPKCESIEFDFVNRSAIVSDSGCKLMIPIGISDENFAPNYVMQPFSVSTSLVLNVFSRFPNSTFQFRKKKNYVSFEQGNINIFI